MPGDDATGSDDPVELESPCPTCGGNEWDVYEPGDNGVADVWFECLTEGCHGVRFAPGPVQADAEAVEAER